MDFLDKIPLDQTALTLAMVAVVGFFILIAVIKGIIKTILALITLALAGAAFVAGFLYSPPMIGQVLPDAPSWVPLAAGAICAILLLVVVQVLRGILTGKAKLPGTGDSGEKAEGKRRRSPVALLFGLFVGTLVLYGTITGIRYFGVRAELEHLQTYVEEGADTAGEVPLIVQAKRWLDDSPIATIQEKIDFLNDPNYRSRLNLAKLIVISGDRADLANALTTAVNREVLETPEIQDLALNADDLREAIEDGDYQKLFDDPRFQRLTTRPSTKRELLRVNLEKFLPTKESE